MYNGYIGGLAHLRSPLRDHMSAQIDDRLAGKNPVTALPIFSVIVHPGGPFTRNPACWAADMVASLTAMSVSNNLSGDGQIPLTLITPRHAIGAAHAFATNGTIFSFVDAASNIITRTIQAQALVDGCDIRVALLDSDIPAALSFLTVLPDNFDEWYLPFPQTPILSGDQEGKAPVRNTQSILKNVTRLTIPTQADRLAFYEQNVLGDSGSGWTVAINNALVVMGIASETFPAFDDCGGSTPFLANGRLNAAIAAADVAGGVATGYTVTNPDLSMFERHN